MGSLLSKIFLKRNGEPLRVCMLGLDAAGNDAINHATCIADIRMLTRILSGTYLHRTPEQRLFLLSNNIDPK